MLDMGVAYPEPPSSLEANEAIEDRYGWLADRTDGAGRVAGGAGNAEIVSMGPTVSSERSDSTDTSETAEAAASTPLATQTKCSLARTHIVGDDLLAGFGGVHAGKDGVDPRDRQT